MAASLQPLRVAAPQKDKARRVGDVLNGEVADLLRRTTRPSTLVIRFPLFFVAPAAPTCHVQLVPSPTPGALWTYSSHGGSTMMASNFEPNVSTERGSVRKSAEKDMARRAVCWIRADLR